MSGARKVAEKAIDNIEPILKDMFIGDYADNEVALGFLLNGKQEIQVQLKVTTIEKDFIETEYCDWDNSFKSLDEDLKKGG